MNKNSFAKRPPMGWNSYDYYDTTVTEADVKKNADFMAEHLKHLGWEYVVVDIEWYARRAGSRRKEYQYIPFEQVCMDEYSRLLPDPERFPSAADGKGFGPLAAYVHEKGLKFGIHIMRGIPRWAAHNHTAIKGTNVTASDIAEASNICFWNPDMYGVKPERPESQLYYDSLMELYASWGVDFIKCDDICREDAASAHEEIRMLQEAIGKCGRAIVLSLSPGPARIEEAWHYEKYANMWRITDDFWDDWKLLKNMFERCELWQDHVSFGNYPDCDMLPLGRIAEAFGNGHITNFTAEEQKTMMTLWSMFGSPLMMGGDLPGFDEETLKLITNQEILHLNRDLYGRARQLRRTTDEAVWVSRDPECKTVYLALFNLADREKEIRVEAAEVEETFSCRENLEGAFSFASFEGKKLEELWGEDSPETGVSLEVKVPAHGVRIYGIM